MNNPHACLNLGTLAPLAATMVAVRWLARVPMRAQNLPTA
jgi:hypothetical protein